MTPLIDGSPGKTIAVGTFFLLIAAAGRLALEHSIGIFSGNRIPGDPGPFFLAFLCLGVIALAGLALLAAGVWAGLSRRGGIMASSQVAAMLREWGLAAAFVATLVAMPAAMDLLGTTLAVGLFACGWIYCLLVTLHGHRMRYLAEAVLFGVGTAVFVNVFFMRLLTLPLPD